MAEHSQSERLERLERVVHIIAEDQVSLQKIVADLASTTRSGFDQLAKEGVETDRRIRETNARIDSLVIAIGEFIRRLPPPSAS